MRKLAERTRQLGNSVSSKVQEIQTQSQETARVAQAITEGIDRTCEVMNSTTSQLAGFANGSVRVSAEIEAIRDVIDTLTNNNQGIHHDLGEMRSLTATMSTNMGSCIRTSTTLTHSSETAMRTLGRSRMGDTPFDRVLAELNQGAMQCEAMLERLHKQGFDVFDKNYQPIAHTNPQQYRTRYDQAFEALFQPFFDTLAGRVPGCDLAVMVTRDEAYPPTHVSKYCQPQTGDLSLDMAHSRDKRFHGANPMLLQCGNSTDPFLFQAYVRDIGDIFVLVSCPVYLYNRHWGGFMLGLQVEAVTG